MVRSKWFVLVIGSFSLAVLPAATFADGEANPITVTVSTPAPDGESEKPRVIHLLGDQTVDLPFVIRGSSEEPVDVRARLVQIAFFLGAPFGDGIEILSERTVNGEPLTVTASLPLPKVTEETDFELRFQAKAEGDAWREAGTTRIRLYSAKILDPLKALSQNVVLRLKDDDEDSKLRRLLESLQVTIVDHRAAVLSTDTPILTLIVNRGDFLVAARLEIRESESVIVFNERVRTLPKVVKSPRGDGQLIQVELEVLRNLDRDPRVQKTFMEIIALAHPGRKRGEEK